MKNHCVILDLLIHFLFVSRKRLQFVQVGTIVTTNSSNRQHSQDQSKDKRNRYDFILFFILLVSTEF